MSDQEQNSHVPDDAVEAIIKWFSPAKGYGFVLIADPKNGTLSDLFFHIQVVRAARIMVDAQQVILIS